MVLRDKAVEMASGRVPKPMNVLAHPRVVGVSRSDR